AARRRPRGDRRRRPGRGGPHLRAPLRPAAALRPGGAAHRGDHRGLRPDRGPAVRAGRAHRPHAPHRRPGLCAGSGGYRTATAACDRISVRLSAPGAHTPRTHLTADLVYALAKVVTELPAALSRRVDPRAGFSLVWGRVSAGSAPNAVPDDGVAEGTVRCLDDDAWHAAPDILKELLDSVVAPYRATVEMDYRRGVPPTVNEAVSVRMLRDAAGQALGPEAVESTPQSLGGEDFAWYLEHVPGALARLGTHPVDSTSPMLD